MPEPRTRIASQRIEGSTVTFTIYAPPDPADGHQAKSGEVTIDTSKFPTTHQAMLSAIGFGRVCEGRWNRKDAGAVGPIIAAVSSEMTDGSWTPGRVFEEREPDDLALALAEVQKVPVHLIQKEMDERMKYVDEAGHYVTSNPDPSRGHQLYKDSKGRPHRYFDKPMRDALAAHPSVAGVLARLTRERAARMAAAAKGKAADDAPDLGGLFGTGAAEQAA